MLACQEVRVYAECLGGTSEWKLETSARTEAESRLWPCGAVREWLQILTGSSWGQQLFQWPESPSLSAHYAGFRLALFRVPSFNGLFGNE